MGSNTCFGAGGLRANRTERRNQYVAPCRHAIPWYKILAGEPSMISCGTLLAYQHIAGPRRIKDDCVPITLFAKRWLMAASHHFSVHLSCGFEAPLISHAAELERADSKWWGRKNSVCRRPVAFHYLQPRAMHMLRELRCTFSE